METMERTATQEPLSPADERRRQVLRCTTLTTVLHARGAALRGLLGGVWRLGRNPRPEKMAPYERSLRALLEEMALDAEGFSRFCPPMKGRVAGIGGQIVAASRAGALDRLVRGEKFRAEAFEVERVTGQILTAVCRADRKGDVSEAVIPAVHSLAPRAHEESLVAEAAEACRPIPILAPGRQEEAAGVLRAALQATRRDWRTFEREDLDGALARALPMDPTSARRHSGALEDTVEISAPAPRQAPPVRQEPARRGFGARVVATVRDGLERGGVMSVGPALPYAAALAGGGRDPRGRGGQLER